MVVDLACFTADRLMYHSEILLTEKASEKLKNLQLSHLSGLLDNERKRAAIVKERHWENAVLLQRQTHLYLTVSEIEVP